MKENEVACFTCSEMFTSKTTLMRHIKKEHGNVLCWKFLKNQCEFSNASCLFTHSKGETINTLNENENSGQVFQNATENLAPPDMTMSNMTTLIPKILTKMMP